MYSCMHKDIKSIILICTQISENKIIIRQLSNNIKFNRVKHHLTK